MKKNPTYTLTMKQQAAKAALSYLEENIILGIGTGSTVNCLIEILATAKTKLKNIVASSVASEQLLRNRGFEVTAFNQADHIDLYIDGADSYNQLKQLTKGGGGALTREKILAYASDKFICIVDASKEAETLGKFPIAIEVLPMARSSIAREIVKLQGQPILRENFTTDNGNVILDVHNWEITEPIALEEKLNNIPGVISNGIFALRGADTIIVGDENNFTTF